MAFERSRIRLESAEERLDFAQRRYVYFQEKIKKQKVVSAGRMFAGTTRSHYLRSHTQYWREELVLRYAEYDEALAQFRLTF